MLARLALITFLLHGVAPAHEAGPRVDAGATATTEDDSVARAAQLYRDGRYADAAAAFEEAYARTGNPSLLFGRAQALRRGGNCLAAIEVFEDYIATSPAEPDREEARRLIAECREILGPGITPPATLEPPPPTPPLDPSPPAARPRPAWHRDMAGGVLLGAGLAIAVAGAATLGAGFTRADDRDFPESQYEARERSVRNLTIAGATLMAAGGALLVSAVIRYAIVARRGRRASSAGKASSR